MVFIMVMILSRAPGLFRKFKADPEPAPPPAQIDDDVIEQLDREFHRLESDLKPLPVPGEREPVDVAPNVGDPNVGDPNVGDPDGVEPAGVDPAGVDPSEDEVGRKSDES